MAPPGKGGISLLALLLGLAGLAIAGGLLGFASYARSWPFYLSAGGLVAGVIVSWAIVLLWSEQNRHLQRLTLASEAIAAGAKPRLTDIDLRDLDAGSRRLWRAVGAAIDRSAALPGADPRMAAILAALPQPVIVITGQALVSLANQAAFDFLGAATVRPGTSLFDAVERSSLADILGAPADEAIHEAELHLVRGGRQLARWRRLPEHGGAVIVMEGAAPGGIGLAHALDLHASPPPRVAPRPDAALNELTVVVLDCESTGLSVGFDRLLSLAAVRLQGAKLVRGETVDVLFDPGEPIPAASTAIHGITDAMVMAEPPLAERWPQIAAMLRDCVVVGHNIGFDLTLLESELRRAGIRWQRPASLCTVQLTAALDPTIDNLNLEAVADAYGIPVTGRHTALGDALVTAEIYMHLLALMETRGDRTLAEAQARAATATRVVRQQQAAGW